MGDLFHRNLLLLSPFLSKKIREFLEVEKECDIETIYTSGEITNLRIGNDLLYNSDADTYIRSQLDVYRNNPHRFYFQDHVGDLIEHTNVSPRDTPEFLLKAIAGEVIQFDSKGPPLDLMTGNGISFGLGLGDHLLEFVETYNFKDLIVCDGYVDFLQISMQHVDWQPIVDALQARGGRIFFYFDAEPQKINLALSSIIRANHPALIEGSYLFSHHSFGPIPEAIERFKESYNQLITYNGWLDDELVHLNNITGNMTKWPDASFITKKLGFSINLPVIIVGSGPSLAKQLEALQKIQDKVVIISSGSSLRILLHADITPDFHCELENIDKLNDIFKQISKERSLKNITLLASYTVTPAISSYFKNTLFLPREGDGISAIMRGNVPEIPSSGRTATMTALAVALFWRCKNIFLFGLDFASTDDGQTHSPNSIYSMGMEGLNNGSGTNKSNMSVPGNFRTEVYTHDLWIYMRQGVEHALLLANSDYETDGQKHSVYNCSDGAFILGTTPCLIPELVAAVQSLTSKGSISQRLYEFYNDTPLSCLKDNSILQEAIDNIARPILQFQGILDHIAWNDSKFEPMLALSEIFDQYSSIQLNDKEEINEITQFTFSLVFGTLLKGFHYSRFKVLRCKAENSRTVEFLAMKSFCELSIHFLIYSAATIYGKTNNLYSDINLNYLEKSIPSWTRKFLNFYVAQEISPKEAIPMAMRLNQVGSAFQFVQRCLIMKIIKNHTEIGGISSPDYNNSLLSNLVTYVENEGNKITLFENSCPVCGCEKLTVSSENFNYILQFLFKCTDCEHSFSTAPTADHLYFYRALKFKNHMEKDIFYDFKKNLIEKGLKANPTSPRNRLVEFDSLDCKFIKTDGEKLGFKQIGAMQIHPHNIRVAQEVGVPLIKPIAYLDSFETVVGGEDGKVSAVIIVDTLVAITNPRIFIDLIADRLESDGMIFGLFPDQFETYGCQIQQFTKKSIHRLLAYRFKNIHVGKFDKIELAESDYRNNFGKYIKPDPDHQELYFFATLK